jgi:fibronectin-binding autotransporter adhesin
MARASELSGRSFRGGIRRRAATAQLLAAAATAIAVPAARATVYVFDPGASPTSGTDGNGVWDTGATQDWFNTSSVSLSGWSNSTTDTAVFGSGGTAGTVTVSGTVNVGAIDFNQVSGSYLLTGGSLNLGSASPVVSGTITTVAGVTPTIATTINGVNAVFNAPGTLTLTGANTFANATGSNIAASVATGTVVMGGGVTETFNGELAVGSGTSPAGSAGSPNVATLTINSGTTASANNNVGLGNLDNNGSATAYQSLFMNVNGTLKSTGLFFTEYQTAQNTTATININSGGNVSAGTFGFGQSAGTSTLITVASGGNLVTTSTGGGDYLGEAAGTNVTLTNNGTVTTNYSVYTNQNGGTSTGVATIVNNGTLAILNGYNFRFGGNTTLTNSGTLTVSGGLFFGNAGGTYTEALNVTGGTMTLAARSDLNSDAAGTGTVSVNISGGTFTDPYYPYLTNGAGQTTTVTQTGGTFNNPSTSTTDGVFFNTGLATYNLAGGTLKTNNVGSSGTPTAGSKFIFNGGTLQAQINSTLGGGFFSPPAAVIGAGGGTIDTQAFNVSAVTPLATGVTGGLDGGLTKLGSGRLSMTGTNTYTGPTNIGGGTLALTGTGSVNGSSVINVNGTGAKLLQLSSVASTPAVTVTNGAIDGTGRLGAVTVGNGTGGIVDDGNGSSGTLTVSSLAFLGGANANLFVSSANLAANNVAPVNVVGTLSSTSAGKVTLNFTSVVSPGSTYDLFQYNAFTGDESGNTPTDFNLGSGISGRVAGSSTLVLTSTTGPGFLELVVGSADNNIRWTGAADNTWTTSQASPTNWVYSNASSGNQTPFFNGDNVTFDDSGTNTNPILISAGNVSPASMTFNNSSVTYSITSSGGYGIAGAGGLVKNGTGVLTMGTSNSYTGGNTINAGTLNIGTATALGSGGQLTLGNGSGGVITLDNTSGAPVTLTNTSLAINNDLTFVGSSSLTLGSGAGTLSGNRTITVSANTLSIPEALSGSASLTKAGAGTLTLSAVNPFNNGNGVTVNGGTLNLGASVGGAGTISGPLTINVGAVVNTTVGNALGYTAGTSVTTVTVNTGSVFNSLAGGQNGYLTSFVLNGGNVTALTAAGAASGGQLQFVVGTGITSLASSTQSNISGGMYLRGQGGQNNFPVTVAQGSTPQPTPGVAGTDLLISGMIGGDANATLVKLGSGVLTLSNNNTYPGGTNVSAGTVNLNAGGPAGTVVGPLTIAGGATVIANATDALGYNTGTSVTTLTVNSGGSLVLNSGGNEGFLTNLVLAGGSVSSGQFDGNGVPTGMFNFSVSGTTPAGITVANGSTGSTISSGVVIRGTGFMPIVANANLTISGPITGSGGITTTGPGTITLIDTYADGAGHGNNTYTGGTNIAGGTIRFSTTVSYPGATPTSFLGTGTTVIQPGGTLGGNGFTGGPVVVAGTITAGQDAGTIGTLTSGAETWNSSGGYVAKITGSSNDMLVMSGLTINAVSGTPFTVFLNGSSGAALTTGGTVLASVSPGTAGYIQAAINANDLVLSATGVSVPTGYTPALEEVDSGSTEELVAYATATPEPTSLLLLALVGAPLTLGRRRRSNRRRVLGFTPAGCA